MTWFQCGFPVPDIYGRSPDAEFILDDDFAEGEVVIDWAALEWRECDIPVEAFGFSHASIETWVMALPWVRLAEEMERIAGIRAWIAEVGGIEAALVQSPLLATVRDGKVRLEDGYHRLGVALFDHGVTHVRALCASLDEAVAKTPSFRGRRPGA